MELTGKKIEEVLNAELVGTDVGYSHWHFTTALMKVFNILAKEYKDLNENVFGYTVINANSVYLTYRGIIFGDASFQKQKGKYHGGRYEWTFKKTFVNLLNEDNCSSYNGLTFKEMIDRIDTELSVKKYNEEEKLRKAKQIFQKIKEELRTTNDFEVINFIKYMNENKYSLC